MAERYWTTPERPFGRPPALTRTDPTRQQRWRWSSRPKSGSTGRRGQVPHHLDSLDDDVRQQPVVAGGVTGTRVFGTVGCLDLL